MALSDVASKAVVLLLCFEVVCLGLRLIHVLLCNTLSSVLFKFAWEDS